MPFHLQKKTTVLSIFQAQGFTEATLTIE